MKTLIQNKNLKNSNDVLYSTAVSLAVLFVCVFFPAITNAQTMNMERTTSVTSSTNAVNTTSTANIIQPTTALIASFNTSGTSSSISSFSLGTSSFETSSSNIKLLPNLNLIDAPEIIAKNAVVYDINNRQFIYSKNADQPVPLASLAKIVTATVFLQLNSFRQKAGNPIEKIQISKRNTGYDKGDRDLIDGEVWKTENLIRYMLITSSNFAAESLIKSMIDDEFSFATLMNKTVKDWGFKSFSFTNGSGLSIPNPNYNAKISNITLANLGNSLDNSLDNPKEIPSAYGSARETAVLFSYIFNKIPFLGQASIIPGATFLNWSGNTHDTVNVNQSLTQIPNIIAGKTGTTNESGGNVMIVVSINQKKYAIVVLGSTIDARYTDLMALAASTEAFATLK